MTTAILTRCGACGASYRVPSTHTGKSATCKKCKTRITIQPVVETPPVVLSGARSILSAAAGYCEHGQDQESVTSYLRRLNEITTTNERVLYVAVQDTPWKAIFPPDAVALTNRRFIVFRVGTFRRVNFYDCLWLHNASIHMREDTFGATLTLRGGPRLHAEKVNWIPKQQARLVYRHGQEFEERSLELRRRREMEATAAGATQINIDQRR